MDQDPKPAKYLLGEGRQTGGHSRADDQAREGEMASNRARSRPAGCERHDSRGRREEVGYQRRPKESRLKPWHCWHLGTVDNESEGVLMVPLTCWNTCAPLADDHTADGRLTVTPTTAGRRPARHDPGEQGRTTGGTRSRASVGPARLGRSFSPWKADPDLDHGERWTGLRAGPARDLTHAA